VKRIFILYDSRAFYGDKSDAAVLERCESNDEARRCRGEHGDMACFSYAEGPNDEHGKGTLIDERHEWNWFAD